MKILNFLIGMAALGFLFSCGTKEEDVVPAEEPVEVVVEPTPEEIAKKEEEERVKKLEAKLEEVNAALNDEDLMAFFKYSTDEKRPTVSEIEKILRKYGRRSHTVHHPEDKKDFVPDIIFVGDAHHAYAESTRHIVSDLTENGDIFVMEGDDREDICEILPIVVKEQIEEGETRPNREIVYGILDSGNYYVYITGMEGPKELFKKVIRAYYAYATGSHVLKYRMPEEPTEEQKRKIELLKFALPYIDREADRHQYEREVDYFAPAIIKAVKKKKKNQFVFVHMGFLHQFTRWMLRRVEEEDISYVTLDYERGHVADGNVAIKNGLVDRLQQKRDGQSEESEKERLAGVIENTKKMDPDDLSSLLYAYSTYMNIFGTRDIDYTITIVERTGSKPKLASMLTFGRRKIKKRKIRYRLVTRESNSDQQDILVDEIK